MSGHIAQTLYNDNADICKVRIGHFYGFLWVTTFLEKKYGGSRGFSVTAELLIRR